MKKLTPYSKDSLDFFKYAVNRKDDKDLAKKLLGLETDIANQYLEYDKYYNNNELALLTPNSFFSDYKSELHSVYEYGSKAIRDLKKEIEKVQPLAVRYVCQNCTLTNNESFDHYIPKEEFPEYSIHCRNLIPSCKTCNGHKSSVWKKEGKLLFLNHYIDIIPDEQFLFVEIIPEDNNEFNFRYYLDNIAGIDADVYRKIETHYDRLNLCERMRQSAVSVISEIENTILSSLKKLGMSETVKTTIETAERNKISYGKNYWKSIAETALVQNECFLQRFDDKSLF